MSPQTKKSIGVWSGDLAGQATDPPRPNHVHFVAEAVSDKGQPIWIVIALALVTGGRCLLFFMLEKAMLKSE
ncbi:hypothetical protein J6590_078784 [Homalodisca vitripennis]|nr:hypothetical protein J6590_078784 [Homalodisca vitripennis]